MQSQQKPDRLEDEPEAAEPSSRWAMVPLALPAIPILALLLASGYLSAADLTIGLVLMFGMVPGVIMRIAMSFRHSGPDYRRLRRMSLPAILLVLAALATFAFGAAGVGRYFWLWGIELIGAVIGFFWWGWASRAAMKPSGSVH